MISRSYQARYYNGSASQPFTADISLSETGLSISYNGPAGISREHWLRNNIIEKEFRSSILSLTLAGEPPKQLDITDRDFMYAYAAVSGRRHKRSTVPGMMIMITLAAVLIICGLCYWLLLPKIADAVALRIPKQQEVQLGRQLFEQIARQSTIDSAKTRDINAFFTQLHTDNAYEARIVVVKSDIPNAFAMPGGGIVLYDAILEHMQQPEELAALLAHEYSHVTLRHTTRTLFMQLAGSAFLSLLLGDMNGTVLQHANELRNLGYSRSFETEADGNGLDILQKNKLDTDGMKNLFLLLKKTPGAQSMEMLSTHPDLDRRIAHVEQFRSEHSYKPAANDSITYYFNHMQHAGAQW